MGAASHTGAGAAEWMAFNKAALESKLLLAITGVGSEPWMDKLLDASATAPGIPTSPR
jgi:hypothetical protein